MVENTILGVPTLELDTDWRPWCEVKQCDFAVICDNSVLEPVFRRGIDRSKYWYWRKIGRH